MSKLALSAACAASLYAVPALSADMIQSYRETAHNKRVVYVDRSEDCFMLRIEYRKPYAPREEFANHCFQPFDLTPTGARISSRVSPGR